ncbi:nucleotidyl transferase AbiEii/AbiGii toxin family protein [Candidatus Woesearchaeota archaeon]|nr:nucleotidyl transferase AbiEii/AbiGii toxin family protein [Candidatus Woesearchaeota archaeon]
MITNQDLKQIADFHSLNLGQAEKYFFQDLVLFILYKKYSKDLVFKGGTALSKCYGFDRFSEDLDFTQTNKLEFFARDLSAGLKNFNITFDLNSKQTYDSINFRLLVQGPLYVQNNKRTFCSLKLDLSLREEVLLDTALVKIRPCLNIIPFFDVAVMSKKEIFAEKIRTVFTRNQARDLYDLYYLDDSVAEVELINKKLKYYKLKFSLNKLRKAVTEKKPVWDKELRHLVKNYPSFEKVKNKIIGYFS